MISVKSTMFTEHDPKCVFVSTGHMHQVNHYCPNGQRCPNAGYGESVIVQTCTTHSYTMPENHSLTAATMCPIGRLEKLICEKIEMIDNQRVAR